MLMPLLIFNGNDANNACIYAVSPLAQRTLSSFFFETIWQRTGMGGEEESRHQEAGGRKAQCPGQGCRAVGRGWTRLGAGVPCLGSAPRGDLRGQPLGQAPFGSGKKHTLWGGGGDEGTGLGLVVILK